MIQIIPWLPLFTKRMFPWNLLTGSPPDPHPPKWHLTTSCLFVNSCCGLRRYLEFYGLLGGWAPHFEGELPPFIYNYRPTWSLGERKVSMVKTTYVDPWMIDSKEGGQWSRFFSRMLVTNQDVWTFLGFGDPYIWPNYNHQTFQVPKMEGFLSLIRLFWGWVFPYISLTYCLYRWVPPF